VAGRTDQWASQWTSIRGYLRDHVTPQQFHTWFRAMTLARVEADGSYVFNVPNSFMKDWIDAYYVSILGAAVTAVAGEEHRVLLESAPAGASVAGSIVIAEAPPVPGGMPDPVTGAALPSAAGGGPGGAGNTTAPGGRPFSASDEIRPVKAPIGLSDTGTELFGHPRYRHFLSDVILNDNYRFGTFISGPSNQLAHAAAMAVASGAGDNYNPLFLHGAVGLGKTHLLQAICVRVLEQRPDTHVVYLSCESFVNQFVAAVRSGALRDFRYRFRNVDLLLIDDIHDLARKERTQEEFFHTFNTLYNSRKQIILTCDSPPRDIPTLEERLVSRFKWGLVTEILEPDYETRAEIVRTKAAQRGVALPAEVIEVIVENITANVRELEGAVVRVCSHASLCQRPLNLELAQEALRDVIQSRERTVSIETIIRVASEHFGQRPSDLMGKRRHKSVSRPRQIAMYLARRMTDKSLVEVGGHFGGRDHSTVIYACEKIARELQVNARLQEDVDIVCRRIRSGG